MDKMLIVLLTISIAIPFVAESKVNPDDGLHFLAFGNYGRYAEDPRDGINYRVAQHMARVATRDEINFIISLGGNFYDPDGITDTSDPRVEKLFDVILGADSLQVPFLATLGTPDCFGNPHTQVELTKKYKRWTMHSTHYTRLEEVGEGKRALFIHLSSCELSCRDGGKWEKEFCEKFLKPQESREAQKQKSWVEDELEKYSADPSIIWRTIVVHNPIFSVGKYGDSVSLKKEYYSIFLEYEIDVVLSAQDDNYQYININLEHDKGIELDEQSLTRGNEIYYPLGSSQQMIARYAKGTHLHQFVSGNGGRGIGSIYDNLFTKNENFVSSISEYGFLELYLSTHSYEIRAYRLTREDFSEKVVIYRD